MSTQKLTNLSIALFLFMFAWSVGLANPLMNWLTPESEMTRYFVGKGGLTLVFAMVFWRFGLFAIVGFTRGLGVSSFVIGLPLLALGVLAFFEPGRAALSTFDLAGWGRGRALCGVHRGDAVSRGDVGRRCAKPLFGDGRS